MTSYRSPHRLSQHIKPSAPNDGQTDLTTGTAVLFFLPDYMCLNVVVSVIVYICSLLAYPRSCYKSNRTYYCGVQILDQWQSSLFWKFVLETSGRLTGHSPYSNPGTYGISYGTRYKKVMHMCEDQHFEESLSAYLRAFINISCQRVLDSWPS